MKNKRYHIVLLAILIVFLRSAHAQPDYSWWNELHDWDGSSHWATYMNLSPGYLGPSALPVPDIRDGRVLASSGITMRADSYFGFGDNTQNIFGKIDIVLIPGRVSIGFFGVPLEHYSTTKAVRDERKSREFDPQGWSAGDLYFSTAIQLIKDHARIPDISLHLTGKTASGENLAGARWTDSPGYYFDLGIGKQLNERLRLHAMAGFFAWQTTDLDHRQNDAFVYGMGSTISFRKITWKQDLSGYAGYLNIKDDPLVFRSSLNFGDDILVYSIGILVGLHDYPFNRIDLSLRYNIPVNNE